MAWQRISGSVRPSRPLSAMAAIVGIGMLLTVALFFVHPFLGGAAFVVLWIVAVLAIVSYHLWNALGDRGASHAHFDVQAETPTERLGEQLRELEGLRRDGLLSDDEYRRKRAELLQTKA